MPATRRLIGVFAFLLALGWAGQVRAQLGVGTAWLRTDAQGKGIILTVEACCNGGLRFIWQIPSMGGQPASTLTVDSPMNGTEVPALIGGKPTGETMAIKRTDDRHYTCDREDERPTVWHIQRHGLGGQQDDDSRQRLWNRQPDSENHRDLGREVT